MNLIESQGHAFLSHSDSNKDFLRKLNEHVKKPEDIDPMRDLLQIVLQVCFITQNIIFRFSLKNSCLKMFFQDNAVQNERSLARRT